MDVCTDAVLQIAVSHDNAHIKTQHSHTHTHTEAYSNEAALPLRLCTAMRSADIGVSIPHMRHGVTECSTAGL